MRNANRWAIKRKEASERGRRRALRRWASPEVGEVDADTVRWRALQDAKGLILREGVTYRGDGTVTPWQVRRAVAGRTDQVEVVADGRVVGRMGRKRLGKALPGGCHG